MRGNVVRTKPELAFTYRPPRVWSAQTRTKSTRSMRATCCEEPWRESSCLCEAPIARMSGALESDTSIRLKLIFSPMRLLMMRLKKILFDVQIKKLQI